MHFLFVLKAKRAAVAQPNDPNQFPTITLYGMEPKSIYTLYTASHQGGFMSSQVFMQAWVRANNQHMAPLFVVLKMNKRTFLVALLPYPHGTLKQWRFQFAQSQAMIAKSAKPASGQYDDVSVTSDMLPIDVLALPHTTCALSESLVQCSRKALD